MSKTVAELEAENRDLRERLTRAERTIDRLLGEPPKIEVREVAVKEFVPCPYPYPFTPVPAPPPIVPGPWWVQPLQPAYPHIWCGETTVNLPNGVLAGGGAAAGAGFAATFVLNGPGLTSASSN